LSAKFISAEPSVTQPTPHKFLGPGFNFAKLAGAFGFGHRQV
jgi:hypothetical protein